MASFRSAAFAHGNYAAFRPTYPTKLYRTVFDYHKRHGGGHKLALDLGTGHGEVARHLKPEFDLVVGTDPSAGMIDHATTLSWSKFGPGIHFRKATAEDCSFISDGAADLVTAGQAAHWFHQDTLWPEMARITRPGSTLAFWGYKDHVLPRFPKASAIIQHYAYAMDPHLLGSYWQQPGRSIVQDKLRQIIPPARDWTDVQRLEYEPGHQGRLGSGKGTAFMTARMPLGTMEEYIRTWSSFHTWKTRFPDRQRRSLLISRDHTARGDVIDEMMDAVRDAEPELRGDGEGGSWRQIEVDVEWGSALLLATKV